MGFGPAESLRQEIRIYGLFQAHGSVFRRSIRSLAAIVEKEPYSRTVSSYIGLDINAYYDVVLSPLLRNVALCAILQSPDGARGARVVVSPFGSRLDFDRCLVSPNTDDLLWRGWHELLHMVIDPWSEFYAREAEELSALYERVPAQARRKHWRDCFSEHMVRAATQRLLLKRSGLGAQRRLADIDRKEGYLFQDALADSLASYESARDKYPTLLDFFPEWLKTWREQK